MQSRSLAFLFIVIMLIPVVAISSNHEIFFTIMSIIVAVISVRYIFRQFSGESFQGVEADEEIEAELEELIDIDIKKFGKGLSIATNLLAILFFLYCAFFLNTIFLKAFASFAIILQIYFIIKKTDKGVITFDPDRHKPQIILSSTLNIAVVIFTLISKLYTLL